MRINIDDTDGDADDTVLYEGRPYTGEVIETDGEGHLIYLNTYVAGRDEGPFREWFVAGGLKTEGQTRRGLPDGLWRQWHENGQLATEEVFDEGELRSRRSWAENGTLTEEKTFPPRTKS